MGLLKKQNRSQKPEGKFRRERAEYKDLRGGRCAEQPGMLVTHSRSSPGIRTIFGVNQGLSSDYVLFGGTILSEKRSISVELRHIMSNWGEIIRLC